MGAVVIPRSISETTLRGGVTKEARGEKNSYGLFHEPSANFGRLEERKTVSQEKDGTTRSLICIYGRHPAFRISTNFAALQELMQHFVLATRYS